MRLVDVDNIRDILTQDWFLEILLTQNGKKEIAEKISNMVYSVPVAYDVDKVVEQVKEKSEHKNISREGTSGYCNICRKYIRFEDIYIDYYCPECWQMIEWEE